MVTKEQAMTEMHFHFNGCEKIVGPRGGVKYNIENWRANGKCKTWKTRPEQFSLPIKYGFRGPYDYLTQVNCNSFHVASECPLWVENIFEKDIAALQKEIKNVK